MRALTILMQIGCSGLTKNLDSLFSHCVLKFSTYFAMWYKVIFSFW